MSRLCRLKTKSHGADGLWAYNEITQLRTTIEQLQARIAELEKDAMRLNWIDKKLFDHQWNGVIGNGSKTYWRVTGTHRHIAAKMIGETFRDAIDAAMKEIK